MRLEFSRGLSRCTRLKACSVMEVSELLLLGTVRQELSQHSGRYRRYERFGTTCPSRCRFKHTELLRCVVDDVPPFVRRHVAHEPGALREEANERAG